MQQGISLDGRLFRPTDDTVGGEVGTDTVFVFRQEGDLIHARYAGGRVRLGYLVGTRTGTTIHVRYAQVNTMGDTATGQSHDRIEILSDGRLRLHERWSWDSQEGSGTSILEEIATADIGTASQ